ncbi:hypothetical protein ALP74_200444 [Pseudomonas coronafaciens pv. garcae]|uniref:Uncharacterized protein n=1 Tax=Pseudomonas coronafaciens pv. garcae TaxID=251653 RepID=A0AB37QKM7_9PSED|nr:hypothetical protein ALP74_200444 [Pseudomonas coronafaciens pv. garcae]
MSSVAHGVGIRLDISHGGCVFGEFTEVSKATSSIYGRYGVGHCDHIKWSARFSQRCNALEDQTVLGPEEIISFDAVCDQVPGLVIEHQTAEHSLFGFHRVRR